ncbi:MAG TPA: NAD(P)H-hydrate epimerase, partial [Pseudomonadales bacterium]|nr:NAD(P)H-hydrate epimerase [Pseudomonadales bacterium]
MLPDTLHTAEETRALDAALIATGISSIALMKKAARAALETLLAHWPNPTYITVFCGSGNNGGDGYLLAALAQEKNISAHIIAVGAIEKFTPDTLQAHTYATQNGVTISPWQNTMDLPSKGIVVDALLGTGSYGAPHHAYAAAIDAINSSGLPVLALDLPSGIDAESG